MKKLRIAVITILIVSLASMLVACSSEKKLSDKLDVSAGDISSVTVTFALDGNQKNIKKISIADQVTSVYDKIKDFSFVEDKDSDTVSMDTVQFDFVLSFHFKDIEGSYDICVYYPESTTNGIKLDDHYIKFVASDGFKKSGILEGWYKLGEKENAEAFKSALTEISNM